MNMQVQDSVRVFSQSYNLLRAPKAVKYAMRFVTNKYGRALSGGQVLLDQSQVPKCRLHQANDLCSRLAERSGA